MDDSGTKHGERVKASILAAGLALWRINPQLVTAHRIGQQMGKSHGAVLYHFTNMAGLRAALAAEAVRIGDPRIVPMLIAARDPAADALSATDRRRFLARC